MKNKKRSLEWRSNTLRGLLLSLYFLTTLATYAQVNVRGKVADATGETLIGVNVMIKGTQQGTVTDSNGEFTISVPSSTSTLVFSYVGFREIEVPLNGRNYLNVTMEQDTELLEEVVVVGYGTMRKSDLTGAVVSANLEAFRESPNLNIMQSLQGSVPGIQIGQTYQTGQEPSIKIRGTNTLGGSQSPLIVVDGIIYRGRIGDLNPHDVKSVEVLKDPSSKAIYGSQAANGVILITTRGGDISIKPRFNYSGSISVQRPTVNARLLNREENLEKIKGVYYSRAYLPPDYSTPNPDFDWRNSTELVPNLIAGIENGTDFDWYDALTSSAHLQNHILSVNGGTEKTSYYLSGGYSKNDGFVLNDQYQRYTVRINIQNNITDWFSIGVNTNGAFTDFSGLGPGSFISTSPFVTPYDENGELSIYPKGASTTHLNPFLSVQADNKNKGNYISGVFFGEIDIPKIDGLRYKINFNESLVWSENFTGDKYGASLTGSVGKVHASRREETLDNILTYEKQLNDHKVAGTLVYGYSKAEYNTTTASGTNVPNINLSYNSLQQALIQEISSGAWDEASLYQMARANYNFKDKYLFTGTLRRDGFSGFSKNNKFSLFPSAGIGWVLTNEPFFHISKIDYLKLRASYGQNGNQTPRYSSLARVSAIDDYKYVFGDGGSSSRGQAIVSLANDNLKWEETAGMNYGIDFGLLENRITGNIEYYKTKTSDLLWDMVIPEITGFSSIKTNIGEIENSGFELYIQSTPVRTKNFSWDFGFNYSTNKNKINKLLGYDQDGDGREDDLVSSGLFIGKSIGTIYHYEIDGIWQIDDDIPTGYHPGNYKIVDQNGDGKITADDDRVFIGKTEPLFSAGFQNNLKYRNFTLRFFINTVQGGKDGYLGAQDIPNLNSPGNFANANHFTFYDHWSVTNPDAKYAIMYHTPQILPTKYCSRSFVRLQDISLAYDLNQSFIKNLGLQNARLYLSGKNLLTFTNWDGWDPEANLGINSGYYPVMKSLSFGIDFEF
ncbi:MAG: TonB-dependent receptor plug [Bacteroidetes bacterium 38_7]|nr:MAG: TonB-dependent receptor plug [Bacteroidetes bacterium 38_7]